MKLKNILKKSRLIYRTDILNYIISKENYKTYLEIGVRNPKENFDKIKIKEKDGVDPCWIEDPKHGNKFELESDRFFDKISSDKKYDLIFIDGLHEYRQVLKDIENSINHLNKNGTILMHDCNPPDEWHQRPISEYDGTDAWNGTTWKAFIEYRCTRSDLHMLTIDTDYGLGMIKFGNQKTYSKLSLDKCVQWINFEKHKKEMLNLISVKDFKKMYSFYRLKKVF